MDISNVTEEINQTLMLDNLPVNEFTTDITVEIGKLVVEAQELVDATLLKEKELSNINQDLADLTQQITEMSRKQGMLNAALYKKDEKPSKDAYTPSQLNKIFDSFNKGGGL